MIRRPPRSTQSRSSAASDVYKRQFLRLLSEGQRGGRILSANVGERAQKLVPGRRRKGDFVGHDSPRSRPAAANTSSMSWPAPASISASPRARSRRISSSCWVRSYAMALTTTAVARPCCVMKTGAPDAAARLTMPDASWRRLVIGTMSGIVPISGTSFDSANGTTDGINETSTGGADNVGRFIPLTVGASAGGTCYTTLSGWMRSSSAWIACAASQRSTARCALSQNSGVLPNSRDRRSAIAGLTARRPRSSSLICLLYTSDAADDLLCVDLGG